MLKICRVFFKDSLYWLCVFGDFHLVCCKSDLFTLTYPARGVRCSTRDCAEGAEKTKLDFVAVCFVHYCIQKVSHTILTAVLTATGRFEEPKSQLESDLYQYFFSKRSCSLYFCFQFFCSRWCVAGGLQSFSVLAQNLQRLSIIVTSPFIAATEALIKFWQALRAVVNTIRVINSNSLYVGKYFLERANIWICEKQLRFIGDVVYIRMGMLVL